MLNYILSNKIFQCAQRYKLYIHLPKENNKRKNSISSLPLLNNIIFSISKEN